MPAYNCANTIEESVNSIFDGNFEDGDELIIVNDYSTDNTGVVLNDLKNRYSQIIIIDHKFNKGGAAARNTAVENSNNSLIFCLDSDNVLASNSINKLKKFLVDNQLDAASFGELHFFNKDINKIDKKWIFKEGFVTANDVLSDPITPVASGNYLYTKESWIKSGRYPEFSGALDAWGFGFRQVICGFKMMAMKDSFYKHRYGHESYWVRDSKISGKISLTALQIIIPFFSCLSDDDINYIMSENSRYSWFEEIKTHPIKIKDLANSKSKGAVELSLFDRIKSYIKKFR